MTIDPSEILAILPEILLVVLALVVLVVDLVLKDEQRRMLGWVTAGGLLFVIIPLLVVLPADGWRHLHVGWGDPCGLCWASSSSCCSYFGAAITAMLAMDYEVIGKRGEFYMLLIISTLGMSVMVMAADLIMLYLAIETTSIPLYVLAGLLTKSDKSVEVRL